VLILLTHANHLYSDRKQVQKMQPYPPLQTLIAAAVLRQAGFDVAFFDSTFDRGAAEAIARIRPDAVLVCEDNFNFLTKMCLLENRHYAFEIAAAALRHGSRALVNSSDATDNPGLYLDAGFECVIRGELEATLLDVFRHGSMMAGAVCRDRAGTLCFGPTRPVIEDLDTLPDPAWDLVDIGRYREAWLPAHDHFAVNLVSSRGCPYRCNWCAKPIFGSSYRQLSPRRVAQQLAHVKQSLSPDRVWFADDIFGLSAKWMREFAAAVTELDARIPFKIQSRCDLMTREIVPWLRDAGCDEVWMGAESGSQRILDAMDKGIRVEHIYQARENLRRHGIRACFFLQFGYLDESWDDVERTINVIRDTRPDDVGISVSYPLPNTGFYDIVKARMEDGTRHWSQSGDLRVMYAGAMSSEFYRALADALHLEVRGAAQPEDLARVWDQVEQFRCACC